MLNKDRYSLRDVSTHISVRVDTTQSLKDSPIKYKHMCIVIIMFLTNFKCLQGDM